jgi:hypothetical protein
MICLPSALGDGPTVIFKKYYRYKLHLGDIQYDWNQWHHVMLNFGCHATTLI